ncbi:MAG: glycosyltransferase family 2 protein [Bacteroidales bacterium]|nr:glycosyltransferase family 2 protein [Bacteroidales bacterium]
MENTMTFSIIIPTYNRAAFLPKAIESVLNQTYTDWELIIVDDGSTDNTREVVSQYNDGRITYIYQQNAERSVARNNGIAHAKGDYVCFLDSDNVMLPNRLQLLAETITKTACYFTDIEYRNEGKDSSVVKAGRKYPFPMDVDMLIQDIIATPQLCCATEILRKHQFNPALSIGEDMELLFRITAEYPLAYVPNQATVVEAEHEGRSVAVHSESSEKQLETLKIMFSKGHPANKASKRQKKWLLSAVLFNASRDYLLEHNSKGVKYLIKSLFAKPIQKNTKYKLNILFSYFCRKQKLNELLRNE